MRSPRWMLVAATMAVALAGCGDGDDAGTVPSPPADTAPAPDGDVTEPTSEELGPEARETVQEAIADLAERTDAHPDDIDLVSFEEVTWSDGSLGCPEPGELYTQALVEGSRTVLELDGTTYHYHAGSGREPFLCERPALDPGADPTVTVPGDPDR